MAASIKLKNTKNTLSIITVSYTHLDVYKRQHTYSDVDLAVWSKKFTGEGLIDFEIVRPLIKKYKNLDIKMYPSGATSENFDPFIDIIEKTGKSIQIVSTKNLPELS